MTSSSSTETGSAGPPPPFDAECAALLPLVAQVLPPTMTLEQIVALRGNAALPAPTNDALSRDGAFRVEERLAPGPQGAPDIPLLVCRPVSTAATGAIYHIHGGGMVIDGHRNGMDEMMEFAAEFSLVVVSVEYRVAPENPHPAPAEDCYAGLLYLVENADELGVDLERIVIAGTSAGGGLAASVALMARDRGGPAIRGQALFCPMLDDHNDTVSAHQMSGIGVWDRTTNDAGWTALLGDSKAGADVSPYAAPARADDLSGLPPTFIDVGSSETFRDEDVAYASRLWAAGVRAELHVWPGGFHGYAAMAPHAQISIETTRCRTHWLRRLLTEDHS